VLPESLQHAADRYIELEREIDRLVPQACYQACRECEGKCCRAGMANQTIRTWWLREISVRVHGTWWPGDWEGRAGCVALTERGCLLTAGRPINCRIWYCQPWLDACRGPWEALFCAFLCELLPRTVRLGPQLSLLDLTEADGPRHARLIARRIEDAHELLGRARTLVDDAADEGMRLRVAFELVLGNPGMLQPALCERLLADLCGPQARR